MILTDLRKEKYLALGVMHVSEQSILTLHTKPTPIMVSARGWQYCVTRSAHILDKIAT